MKKLTTLVSDNYNWLHMSIPNYLLTYDFLIVLCESILEAI